MFRDEHLLTAVQGPTNFPLTHWSLILQAGGSQEERAAEALNELCRSYWYPLYAYVRRRGFTPEDAQDLTQAFIQSLLFRQDLMSVAPSRGRFRTFLLTSLTNFLANHWRSIRREKRGGSHPQFSFDALTAEERYRLEPATDETPDRLFDRKWAWELMNQARQALRAEYTGAGKEDVFALLEPFLVGGRDAELRTCVATTLGVSTGAVDVALHRLRKRYGEIVRELIAQTVAALEDVDTEIQHLMIALSQP